MSESREPTREPFLLKTWASGFKTWARWSDAGWLQVISQNQRGTMSVRIHLDETEVARLREFLGGPPPQTSAKETR